MKRTYSLGVLLLCLAASFPAAFGQGNCTIRTIVGTYAFNSTGSSTIITAPPVDGFHWSALHAPIAGAGLYTVKPDGTASGRYWIVGGAMDIGPRLNPVPIEAVFTVNPDCTGSFTYTFGPYSMSEQMVILDNGNEIRSVAAQTAVPTSTWISVSRRVSSACNPNKLAGTYVLSCKSLFAVDAAHTFAGTALIRLNIARDGSAAGVFMGKFGPGIVPPSAVTAQFKLNSDCTAEGTLDFGVGQNVARGVFFDEGRQAYWMPMINNPGSVPQPYGFCEIKQTVGR